MYKKFQLLKRVFAAATTARQGYKLGAYFGGRVAGPKGALVGGALGALLGGLFGFFFRLEVSL